MAKKTYQIQIALKGVKPKIWRRVLVDSDISLNDFHNIIQAAMGWTNSHLHSFSDGFEEYAPEDLEIDDTIDSETVKLDEILQVEKDKITYEYDFGDGWEHNIILEKILLPDTKLQMPRCIAGKRNCPPEDCGGIWGYEDLLEIINQPDHEQYKEYKDWLGDEFDSEYFDMDEINDML